MKAYLEIKEKYKLYGPKFFVLFSLRELKRLLYRQVFLDSYSHDLEDLEIERALGRKENIFYIDVGANHPKKFNNTYRFYKRGGRGISIEPCVHLYEKLEYARPKDTNLNIGLSDEEGIITFYNMFPDVSSTFDKAMSDKYMREGCTLISKEKIQVTTLKKIFEDYVHGRKVDVLNVDVEGYDINVIKGNDWKKYRPKVICIEVHAAHSSPKIHKFLKNVGYEKTSRTELNGIYVDAKVQ